MSMSHLRGCATYVRKQEGRFDRSGSSALDLHVKVLEGGIVRAAVEILRSKVASSGSATFTEGNQDSLRLAAGALPPWSAVPAGTNVQKIGGDLDCHRNRA